MAGLTDVLVTLAGLLVQGGAGIYTVGTAPTDFSEPLIVMKNMPSAPDRVIVLNIVIQSAVRDIDTTDTYLNVMIQTRCRGAKNDPFDVDAIAESVATVLNGVTGLTAGTYTVVSLARQTHIQNGMDAADRYEVISQFYGQITAH